MRVGRVGGIEDVGRETWRALEPPEFPFFDFEFLRALERSGSVGRRSGWSPAYLVCSEASRVLGALCVYSKTDSYGEYIFDWEWARAYQQYGLPYYPKLVAAVPFTPATGPKLLVRQGANYATRERVKGALLDAAKELGVQYGVSSSHALFVPEEELEDFEAHDFMVRHSLQFHWHNRGYDAFGDYLGALSGKRRRQISRERRQLDGELEIEHLTGEALRPEHAALMHRFYLATLDGKWGVPYLNGAFFDAVFRAMRDRILLVLASDTPAGPRPARSSSSRTVRCSGATGGPPRSGVTSTSSCATTRPSSSPSRGNSSSSRPARRASTSWRAGFCLPSPTAHTISGTPASGLRSGTT